MAVLISGFFLALAILIALVVLAAIAGLVSLVFGLVVLPFQLLGLVFRGLALVLVLPFLLLIGLAVGALVGIPLLFALVLPLLPLVLLVAVVVWLFRRGSRQPAPTH